MARILVAEDMPDILEVLRMGLTMRGFEVIVARDGEAALTAAVTNPLDLAIIDIHMPKMRGTEVVQRVRATALPYQFPIILLTADTNKEAQELGMQAGASAYCTKPFRMAEMFRLIASLLPGSETGVPPTTP